MTKYAAAKPEVEDALELYAWNAQVSAELMVPAHFAEVLTRNAVSDALTLVYGERWPWSNPFRLSLPNPRGTTYNPRRDLEQVACRYPTTGKVIAELKFVFWQKMFTARHDERLWRPHIQSLFPNASEHGPRLLRKRVYDDLEHIRLLRNRIAHHEPVITRDLQQDLRRMLGLVAIRSSEVHTWLRTIEEASLAIETRP